MINSVSREKGTLTHKLMNSNFQVLKSQVYNAKWILYILILLQSSYYIPEITKALHDLTANNLITICGQ